tara:strand:+ start:616 stop:801 length:186 start_codon:yes stop_codon:yes gene_type:complete
MQLHFSRDVLTEDGMATIEFLFDTETLQLTFDPKYLPIMKKIYQGSALDIPETEQVQVEKD